MVDLARVVSRRTTRPARLAHGKRLVVTLLPGDIIQIRPERSRTAYEGSLEDIYRYLAQQAADRLRLERKKERVQKTRDSAE